jgi:hypothetical protein
MKTSVLLWSVCIAGVLAIAGGYSAKVDQSREQTCINHVAADLGTIYERYKPADQDSKEILIAALVSLCKEYGDDL